ncbi:MAG: DNA polymerase elongation subunit (family B) [Candidatus Thermoplasmatota archaeon]|nr:DNA polymerase elongation subunit (family B) [Candidatus Thermoplasmatota archaeon]MBU1941480.1 DNA polymerase elongation subunit (family B) [Candidatus Thermoplasmatota archaeon]
MTDLLLGVSPEFLYFSGVKPVAVQGLHEPYFLAFCPQVVQVEKARAQLVKQWQDNRLSDGMFSKISRIGEVEQYQSFWEFGKKRPVFKVFCTKSYLVPDVSDELFFRYGFFTGEHDIPYQQRMITDFEGSDTHWVFDTQGKSRALRVLVYDIETSQFQEGKTDVPIDIIGSASFPLKFSSYKDLATEGFSISIDDVPTSWEEIEITQKLSRSVDEEVQNLLEFCQEIFRSDVISGHNIIGFDNRQIQGRISWFIRNKGESLSKQDHQVFKEFLEVYSRPDKSFHYGIRSEAVQVYPTSLDTYLGVRKFYSFLNDFSLKAVAPFLGIMVPNRIILTPSQIKLDQRTLLYNRQDIQEQLGVTLMLIQQALPLAFTTGMPFDMLLSSGAVTMWDHMAMIRSGRVKKIMPPTCRVMTIAQTLMRSFKGCETRSAIVKQALKQREQLSKDIIRVIKYGEEMPEWVEYPYVIFNQDAKDTDDLVAYHMPGGMTLKPDSEAFSHFIPWWYVMVADVGAMYPTILKAMNIGADTVRLAKNSETPDAWIWLKRVPEKLLKQRMIAWRNLTDKDSYADKGVMLGVCIDHNPGVVNCAMTGIMSVIAKVKTQLKQAYQNELRESIEHLVMMYQSVKGARNAGTHGILAAPMVSGRQFNLWGATAITTKGQMILADTLEYLQSRGIRVVYGDTDGIYIGCARSVASSPKLKNALEVTGIANDPLWLTQPDEALQAIEACNTKWQTELDYPDFELEAEKHDAMLFVKHKNYLIFDENNGRVSMVTKGNNFKGSDKANIARIILKDIMLVVLHDHPSWEHEEDIREEMKVAIMKTTQDIVAKLDLSQVDIDDLTLVQSVQPTKRYKTNQDGSISTFGRRVQALEQVLGEAIRSRIKLKFVVTKKPLPGISNPSKSGVKPIDYMYPVELLKDKNEIDLEWYKEMIVNYIQGAFGISSAKATEQMGLDSWM